MERVGRWLFTLSAVVNSLVLALTVGVEGVRSYERADGIAAVLHYDELGNFHPMISLRSECGSVVLAMDTINFRSGKPVTISAFRFPDRISFFSRLTPVPVSTLADQDAKSHRAFGFGTWIQGSLLYADGSGQMAPPTPRVPSRAIADQRSWFLPHWFLIILSTFLPILWLRRTVIRRWRNFTGCCPICGYDLCATPERCPECGQAARECSTKEK